MNCDVFFVNAANDCAFVPFCFLAILFFLTKKFFFVRSFSCAATIGARQMSSREYLSFHTARRADDEEEESSETFSEGENTSSEPQLKILNGSTPLPQNDSDKSICLGYCGNKGVFPLLLLSVLSVLEYNSRPISLYLITMDMNELNEKFVPFSENQRAILERELKRVNPRNKVTVCRMEEEYRAHLLGGKNENGFYTPYAQLRLLFDLIPALPDKLLYLDTDVMCTADLSALWDTDVSEYQFGAVRDAGMHFIRPNYFNSGVMLINLKKIRRTGCFIRVRERVKNRRMIMPDQSALNDLVKNRLFLPRKFNEQRGLREDTALKHFCRGVKWYGPIPIIYNYKQSDREKVHKKLKTDVFDAVYEKYDEIVKTNDILF